MTPVVLRGTNPNLQHFAHIRIAPMFAAPVVIASEYPGGVSVRVELPIYDRNDGARWSVGTEQQMADEGFEPAVPLPGYGRQVAEEMVRRCLKQALSHEVDECLRDDAGGWLGGDPHAKGKR